MTIDESVKTYDAEFKKIENNNRHEGFISYEEENGKDEVEKYKSDDKKVASKKKINECEEYKNNNISNMEIEKYTKVNSDKRMNNGEGTMTT